MRARGGEGKVGEEKTSGTEPPDFK